MAGGIPSVAVSIINEASLILRRLSEYLRSTATLKSWKISFISQNIGKWQENVLIVLKKRQKTLTLRKWRSIKRRDSLFRGSESRSWQKLLRKLKRKSKLSRVKTTQKNL